MNYFITGVTSGIGREAAKLLTSQGHQVKGLARRRDELEKLQTDLGKGFSYEICDISDSIQREETAIKLLHAGYLPDACILNAGGYFKDINENFIFSSFQMNLKTNLGGAMHWVGVFLPEFQKRGFGSFIGVSSTSAFRPGYSSIGYSTSKSALTMAFRGLRLNVKDRNIKFTTVHFGPIDTQLWHGRKSFLVPSAKSAADYLVTTLNKKSGIYYFPFFSTFLFRLSLLFPDFVFSYFSGFIKK